VGLTVDTTPVIRATGLGKRFGRHWALAHFDLEVHGGEVVLLFGANGSGKTTFLRLAAGLHKPTRGSLSIQGHDSVKEPLECRRLLSMVAHDNYLYARLTALETLRVWARLLGSPTRDSDLIPLLEEVGLAERRRLPVGGFSAGMKKRLTLLRTRLEQSKIVLLDEPFSALDVAGQDLVEGWVERFREEGRTVVMASHNLPRASKLCDRAVSLEQGQIVWTGSGSELFKREEKAS
jgi:ABC-type multidrug transport system ATPase subunit